MADFGDIFGDIFGSAFRGTPSTYESAGYRVLRNKEGKHKVVRK